MDLKTFYKSKKVKYALWALVSLAILLFVFQAGMVVGLERAEFSSHLGDNYSQIFDDGNPGQMMTTDPLGYGTFGIVLNVSGGNVSVATSDNLEKIVKITSDTLIRRARDQATTTDLKAGDAIVVVGTPNPQGQIEARLIRIVSSL